MKKPDTLDDFPTNLSANEHFQSVVARAVSRRGFLKSGLGLSAAAFLSGSLAACTSDDDASVAPSPSSPPAVATPLLSFEGIPTSTADDIVVAAGYTATVFAPWGTPLFSSGPGSSWAGDASEGAAEQARQVGDNHDGLHFFPLTEGNNDEGLLVMNHEYTNLRWLFANGQVDSLDDANKDGFTVGEEIKFGDHNGGFSQVSMGLAITKTSKCVAEAATLINFLLNEEKGASIMGSECGIPASKAGLKFAQDAGAVKELIAEANAKVMAFTTNKLDPLFENNDLKASGTGIYQEVFDNIDYGDQTPEEAVETLLDGMESVGYTIG